MAEARTPSGMPRVLMVVGTRPEAIKMAPVAQALVKRKDLLESRLLLTGQHDGLVDQVLQAFDLVPELRLLPDFDLAVMREGQDLYDLSHACLHGLRDVAREFRPDLVLVQGDTASVFLSSLVAFFEKVGVGHVESGLRSGDKWAPYPEEMFRRLADALADFHFAPTPRARDNLLGEGVPGTRVYVTGNTVVDALLAVARFRRSPRNHDLRRVLEGGNRLVLLTAHRRESFGNPLKEVFGAVRELADREEGVEILYPVHPNPQVLVPAQELLSGHPRIRLTEPLDYLDLVSALERAALVLTDSGGIQEEAPTFGAPVLVLRDVTERPEGVEAGVARLVGTDGRKIVESAVSLLRSPAPGAGRPRFRNPYGDGRAGERIADIVTSALAGVPRVTRDWGGV
jgi:UDP-N-acetylglucosamine 2-epimerase (non-hydrolysing)